MAQGETIQISGHTVNVSDNCVKIYDSYQVSKKDFKKFYKEIRNEYPENKVMKERKDCGLNMEWATHNFLYNLDFKRSQTKDVDLNYPQKWYVKLAYALVGPIAWLFIK